MHSHGRIPPFFSSIDDASELGFPGFHATFGNLYLDIPEFCITASIVHNFTRYCIDANHYIEISKDGKSTYDVNLTYHPAVLNQLNVMKKTIIDFEINEPEDIDLINKHRSNDYSFLANTQNKKSGGNLYKDFLSISKSIYSEQEKKEFIDFRQSIERQFIEALDTLSNPSPGLQERLLEEFISEVADIETSGYDIDSMKDALLSFCNSTFHGQETDFSYKF